MSRLPEIQILYTTEGVCVEDQQHKSQKINSRTQSVYGLKLAKAKCIFFLCTKVWFDRHVGLKKHRPLYQGSANEKKIRVRANKIRGNN